MNIVFRLFTPVFLAFLAFNAAAATYYVDINSTDPTPPYTSWATASTNIQSAVDQTTNGDTVLVNPGVYATGGRNWFGGGTNRVTLTNTVTLQSVGGPTVTLIVGSYATSTELIPTRCVGIGNGALLSGFTLTNGQAGIGNYPNGGGVAYIYGVGAATLTNCVLIGNLATNSGGGGGAYGVTLVNCQIMDNSARVGGGAYICTLMNCLITSNTAISGGGISASGPSFYGPSFATNCTIIGNSASSSGGGVWGGALNACVVSNNSSPNGGGAYGATLNNCLIVGNSASTGGGLYGGVITNCTVASNVATNDGGGIFGATGIYVYNSIIYFNYAPSGSNTDSVKFFNCCTSPDTYGSGITNDPAFVNLAAGDYHLQSNSPCINSGNNTFVSAATDLDGNPRIVRGTVDIGAYEYQTPTSIISYAYLQQYGLPTDGSVDFADLDGTAFNVYQDWVAGLNPTNSASVLALLPPSPNASGIKVTWQSVSQIQYYLQRSTNLSEVPAFTTIQSPITGQPGATSIYADTTATNNVPYFYRVGVIPP